MITITVQKNNSSFIKELQEISNDYSVFEAESFGEDAFLQIVLPVATLLIPAIQSIILKILEKNKIIEIEWDGVKIKGTKKEVREFLDYVLEQEQKKGQEKKDASNESA